MASMELLAQSASPPLAMKPQRPLAAGAVVLALTGLMLAVGAPAFLEGSHTFHDDTSAVLAEGAHRIKDHLAHKEIEVQSHSGISWKSALVASAAMVGFLGAALGTASWARRESTRWSCIAIAAGLSAIAWNYFFLAAVAAVGLFLMAWIISHFQR